MATNEPTQDVKVYVGKNLPQTIQTQHLRRHFKAVKDDIKQCFIVAPNGQSKGFGFVIFRDLESAKRAIEQYNGTMLLGVNITVQLNRHTQKKQSSGRSHTYKRRHSHPPKIEVKHMPSQTRSLSTSESVCEHNDSQSNVSSQDYNSSLCDVSEYGSQSQLSCQDFLLDGVPTTISASAVEKR